MFIFKEITFPLIWIGILIIIRTSAYPTLDQNFPVEPTKPKTDFTYWGAYSEHRTDLCNSNFTNVLTTSGIVGERYRWKDAFVVHPDPAFSQLEYNIINAALYDLSQVLCIGVKIWPKDSRPTGDYAFIKRGESGTGCNSLVGRQGGIQVINLQYNGCINKGTVIHEAVHALGYWHEQSRPDRDNYVNINWNNIHSNFRHNFDKETYSSTFNVPYDQRSIMHYGGRDFSSNGKETIVAKNGGSVGSTGVLTNLDIQKLKKMYNCQ